MAGNFIVDTVSLRSYFRTVFGEEKSKISSTALKIIDGAFNNHPKIRLSIPSIVFVEIYEKTFRSREFQTKFRHEVFELIRERNIEIKPIDREVLENFITIDESLENHDRIILASAMMMQCPLITCDTRIIKYVKRTRVVKIIS